MEHKFGNAVRAMTGGAYTLPRNDMETQVRIKRWMDRLKRSNGQVPKILSFAPRG